MLRLEKILSFFFLSKLVPNRGLKFVHNDTLLVALSRQINGRNKFVGGNLFAATSTWYS